MAVNTGALYLVTPKLALDGGLQFGLSDEAPTFAAFAGFSVALGRFKAHDASASCPDFGWLAPRGPLTEHTGHCVVR